MDGIMRAWFITLIYNHLFCLDPRESSFLFPYLFHYTTWYIRIFRCCKFQCVQQKNVTILIQHLSTVQCTIFICSLSIHKYLVKLELTCKSVFSVFSFLMNMSTISWLLSISIILKSQYILHPKIYNTLKAQEETHFAGQIINNADYHQTIKAVFQVPLHQSAHRENKVENFPQNHV